jgi:1-acyl-sn-glycerol-3-phosphate acyltransferase
MRAKTGAARIALAADVPVVPVAVVGAEKVPHRFRQWQRPLVTVRFGAPLYRQGSGDDVALARQYIDEIMAEIAALLPPEQRGEFGVTVKREPDGAAS